MIYLDASALVKIVVAEPESGALLAFLRSRPERMSSALSLTEVPRALRRARFDAAVRRRAQRVLASWPSLSARTSTASSPTTAGLRPPLSVSTSRC